MTLAKAIEAAKRAFKCDGFRTTSNMIQYLLTDEEVNGVRDALAALPDKPMTEDELLLIVKKHVKGMANPETVRATIQALKSAGVLYVDEK